MENMSELNKMLTGELYDPSDVNLSSMRDSAKKLISELNFLNCEPKKLRVDLIQSLFGSTGNEIQIEANFNCDYGKNIYVGESFFANFGCVILDCARVQIGNNCLIGPQVGIYTACHPLDPTERNQGFEFAKPITIGDNCWIGGHATINPGVRLGNNVVVASGAVVTKSFANNVVIAGNPARVLKHIK